LGRIYDRQRLCLQAKAGKISGTERVLEHSESFRRDDPRTVAGAIADSQHKGAESWRETTFGTPSFHFAIAADECSIHIDTIGFLLEGPDGAGYSPDLFQHVINDLLWQKIVNKVYEKSSRFGEVLYRTHPCPISSHKYRLEAGIEKDVLVLKDQIGSDLYKLSIDFSYACLGGLRLCENHGPVLTVEFRF
jgi:hypothetical protein